MKRIGAWLFCGCCATLGLFALAGTAWPAKAGQAVKADQFTEATEVLVVEVPVQVLRGGEPVRGLTAEDFELWEGREKQQITGFEVLDLSAAGPAAPRAAQKTVVPPSARRRFLLLFDLSFSEPKTIEKARQAARTPGGRPPPDRPGGGGDLPGVPRRRARPRLHPRPAAARDSPGAPRRNRQVGRSPPPGDEHERERVHRLDARVERGRRLPGRGGNRGGGDTENPTATEVGFVDNLIRESERTQQAAQKNNITELSESVGALARMLAGIEGRKHVVFLSEGFDSRIPVRDPGCRPRSRRWTTRRSMARSGGSTPTPGTAAPSSSRWWK